MVGSCPVQVPRIAGWGESKMYVNLETNVGCHSEENLLVGK
jgi:hypothetical protein